jgi:hypothetical protein
MNHLLGTEFDATSTWEDFRDVIPNSYGSNYHCGPATGGGVVACHDRANLNFITRHNDMAKFYMATDSDGKADPSKYGYWYLALAYHNDGGDRVWGGGSRHRGAHNWIFGDGHSDWLPSFSTGYMGAPNEWEAEDEEIAAHYITEGLQICPNGYIDDVVAVCDAANWAQGTLIERPSEPPYDYTVRCGSMWLQY